MISSKDVPSTDFCVLCGKKKNQVDKLIVGLHGAICTVCVATCDSIMPMVDTESWDLVHEILYANQLLPKAGLVTMHSGNASGYDPETGLLYIKPSGVDYDSLTANLLVAVELASGQPKENQLRPSVDLPHHLFIYRNMPGVRGVVHTHSNYATAFATAGLAIEPFLTAIADEFGGPIPCAPYVDNDGDNIGQAILRYRNERAPAILLANHGVFVWGDSPRSALKAAVMVEDVAKTVWLSMQIGRPEPLPPFEVEKWWDRYQNRYGQ